MMVDWAALDRGVAALDGTAGLIVLDAEGRTLYERDPDATLPAASVIKIPILMSVYADAADGRLSLDERVAVGQHLPGTGVLGRVSGVTDLTVRDHATLMTIVKCSACGGAARLKYRLPSAKLHTALKQYYGKELPDAVVIPDTSL